MLEQERQYYEENLSAWLSQYAGRFVLIRGAELVGVYDTHEQALAEGARRFGLAPALVRRVQAVQPEESVPALTLGLLHAHSDSANVRRGSGA